MADAPVVHIAENSAEQVAYKLFREIASAEGRTVIGSGMSGQKPDRKWILSTYRECLYAVRTPAIAND
jgi:hypothetical protein